MIDTPPGTLTLTLTPRRLVLALTPRGKQLLRWHLYKKNAPRVKEAMPRPYGELCRPYAPPTPASSLPQTPPGELYASIPRRFGDYNPYDMLNMYIGLPSMYGYYTRDYYRGPPPAPYPWQQNRYTEEAVVESSFIAKSSLGDFLIWLFRKHGGKWNRRTAPVEGRRYRTYRIKTQKGPNRVPQFSFKRYVGDALTALSLRYYGPDFDEFCHLTMQSPLETVLRNADYWKVSRHLFHAVRRTARTCPRFEVGECGSFSVCHEGVMMHFTLPEMHYRTPRMRRMWGETTWERQAQGDPKNLYWPAKSVFASRYCGMSYLAPDVLHITAERTAMTEDWFRFHLPRPTKGETYPPHVPCTSLSIVSRRPLRRRDSRPRASWVCSNPQGC